MTDLTDEAVKALLDDVEQNPPRVCISWCGKAKDECACYRASVAVGALNDVAPDLARALLEARAENARLRADADAEVALVVERAAELADCGCKADQSDCLFISGDVTFCYREGLPDIRALTPASGMARVEALRKERDDAVEARDAFSKALSQPTDGAPSFINMVTLDYHNALAADLAAAQEQIEALQGAAENVVIASHMGWDLDGVLLHLEDVLAQMLAAHKAGEVG